MQKKWLDSGDFLYSVKNKLGSVAFLHYTTHCKKRREDSSEMDTVFAGFAEHLLR